MCVELETGKKLWERSTCVPAKVRCDYLGRWHLIFRYQDGTVALIEANPNEYVLKGSFKPVFQERESWSQPCRGRRQAVSREQNKLMIYNVAK